MRRNVEPRSKILRRKPDFGHEDVPSRTRGRCDACDRRPVGFRNDQSSDRDFFARETGWLDFDRKISAKKHEVGCCRARKTDVASDKRSETPHVLPRGAVTRHGDAFGDTASVEAFPRTKANASPRGPRRSSATRRVGRASHRVAATSVFRERGTEGNDSAEKRMRTFALAPRPPPGTPPRSVPRRPPTRRVRARRAPAGAHGRGGRTGSRPELASRRDPWERGKRATCIRVRVF